MARLKKEIKKKQRTTHLSIWDRRDLIHTMKLLETLEQERMYMRI